MKKAIIYQNEECVIIKPIKINQSNFAFFVAVNSKKVVYLKENYVHGESTFVSLDKLVKIFPQYQNASTFNIKIILDTFVNTINYKITSGAISDSDELLEIIYQFEKLIKDPYIVSMTNDNSTVVFSKQAMYEVTNAIKKLDGKVKKTVLTELLNNEEKGTNDVFLSQNWLDDVNNKDIVYQSIMNSNKAHHRSPIDFLFNNKVLNIYMITIIISIVAFISCIDLFSTWKSTGADSEEEIDLLREEALIEDEEINLDENAVIDSNLTSNGNNSNVASNKTSSKTSNKTSNKTSSTQRKYGKDYYNDITTLKADFAYLKKRNSDTVAYIKVQNTQVSYPVVQTNDNSYYLNHSFDKKSNVAGWIFGDYRSDFTNFKRNTVIYGHGRTDQVMFGSLEKTLEPSWYNNKNNLYIQLDTPKASTVWKIVSIYTIKAEAYYLSHNFENNDAYKKWIDTMVSRSKFKSDYKPTIKDKFLTLSTCKDYKGNRIVVQAVLVKTEKK